jgi:hypothetical protein
VSVNYGGMIVTDEEKEAAMAKIASWVSSDAGKLAMAKIQETLEAFKKKMEDNAKVSQEDTERKI